MSSCEVSSCGALACTILTSPGMFASFIPRLASQAWPFDGRHCPEVPCFSPKLSTKKGSSARFKVLARASYGTSRALSQSTGRARPLDQYTKALCEREVPSERVAGASRAQLTAGSSFTGRGDIIMVTATSDYLLIVCTRPSSCTETPEAHHLLIHITKIATYKSIFTTELRGAGTDISGRGVMRA